MRSNKCSWDCRCSVSWKGNARERRDGDGAVREMEYRELSGDLVFASMWKLGVVVIALEHFAG